MRSLKVIGGDGNSVTLGFSNAEAAEKAFYSNVGGAGRRHAIRKFMGVPESVQKEIDKIAKEGVSPIYGG